MNVRKNLVALTVAAVLGAGPLTHLAHAADAPPPAAASDVSSADPARTRIIGTVDEARQAVQDIHAARLAIFDGLTDDAARFVEDAVGNLDEAQSSLASLAMPADGTRPIQEMGRDGQTVARAAEADSTAGAGPNANDEGVDDYLPFDTSISLLEDFVPQPQHQEALQQAGQKMQQGDERGAADSLQVADIELSVSAAMIPAKSSLDQLRQAERLIGERKWQEANLALKSIEDSIVVGSWTYGGVPDQGIQGDGAMQDDTPADAAGQNG